MTREEEIKQEAERVAFERATTDLRVHIMNLKAEADHAKGRARALESELESERAKLRDTHKRYVAAMEAGDVIGGEQYPPADILAAKLRDSEKRYKAALVDGKGMQDDLKKAEERAKKSEDIIARIQGAVIEFEDAAGLEPERHANHLVPNRIRALRKDWEDQAAKIERIAKRAASLEDVNKTLRENCLEEQEARIRAEKEVHDIEKENASLREVQGKITGGYGGYLSLWVEERGARDAIEARASNLADENDVLRGELQEEREARIRAEKEVKRLNRLVIPGARSRGTERISAFIDKKIAENRQREAETPVANVTAEDFLIKENAALTSAGWDLAEAAMRVGRESDGVHRLMLATAKWVQAIANEGGRRERHAEDVRLGGHPMPGQAGPDLHEG